MNSSNPAQKREVTTEEGELKAKEFNAAIFTEASAKDDVNIKTLFRKLAHLATNLDNPVSDPNLRTECLFFIFSVQDHIFFIPSNIDQRIERKLCQIIIIFIHKHN